MIQKLIETSRGWVTFDVSAVRRLTGLSVLVVAFGPDGWQSGRKSWVQKYSDESLADVLQEVSGVPRDEAERIAADLLRDWEGSGWEEELRKDESRVIPFLVSTFGLATVGVLALLAVGAWLVVRAV